jgi:hypothetical protein
LQGRDIGADDEVLADDELRLVVLGVLVEDDASECGREVVGALVEHGDDDIVGVVRSITDWVDELILVEDGSVVEVVRVGVEHRSVEVVGVGVEHRAVVEVDVEAGGALLGVGHTAHQPVAAALNSGH